jgi:glutathione peroxidase
MSGRRRVRMTTTYDFVATTAEGTPVPLADYDGKVLLIVNVASKCGLTPQYEGLESLYRDDKDRGLEILGFPCNQFKEQEPGSDAEIQAFCKATYDVTFPVFAKIDVNGPGADPLYTYLRQGTSGPSTGTSTRRSRKSVRKRRAPTKSNGTSRSSSSIARGMSSSATSPPCRPPTSRRTSSSTCRFHVQLPAG